MENEPTARSKWSVRVLRGLAARANSATHARRFGRGLAPRLIVGAAPLRRLEIFPGERDARGEHGSPVDCGPCRDAASATAAPCCAADPRRSRPLAHRARDSCRRRVQQDLLDEEGRCRAHDLAERPVAATAFWALRPRRPRSAAGSARRPAGTPSHQPHARRHMQEVDGGTNAGVAPSISRPLRGGQLRPRLGCCRDEPSLRMIARP